MKFLGRVGLGGFLFPMTAFVFLIGCEVTSRSRSVEINPDTATLLKGQKVELTASGGEDFVWSLSDSALGTLSSGRGETVVYTSLVAPATPVVQTVTVVAGVTVNTTNNTVTVEKTANAFITHVGGGVIATSQVSVSPSTAGLQVGQSVTLTASGDSSYTWSLETPAWGALSRLDGRSVFYIDQYADPDGKMVVQHIKVVGARGGSAQVDIAHLPGNILSINPETANLRVGESATFEVWGGSGDYTWTLSQPAWGTLSHLTGSETTYKSFHSNTVVEVQTITATDSSSGSVKGYVYHIP